MRSKSRNSASEDRQDDQDCTGYRDSGGVCAGDSVCSADDLGFGQGSGEGCQESGHSLQSDVAQRYWTAATESTSEAAKDGLREGDEVLNHAEKFNRVTKLAVATLEDILNEQIPYAGKEADRLKMLSIKKDAAASVLSLALRADESKFRTQSMQGVMALLEEVRKMKTEPAVEAVAVTAIPLLDSACLPPEQQFAPAERCLAPGQ